MSYEKLEQLYEGKAKKVFATSDPNVVIVSYKDDATAFNGLKKGTITGKGAINNRMTNNLMRRLEEKGVPTHYVEELSDRETAVKKVSIVPLEVIIRNISAGSFAKRFGVEEGIVFDAPTIEFSYKNDDLGDPLMNSYHALALKLATQEEIDGSATILILDADGILAARDKLGRLPVLIGQGENGCCVSFESFAYHKLGYHDAYELGPREIVRVTAGGWKTLSPAGEQMKICAFLWTYYGYPNSNYEGMNVEVMRYRNGEIMARDEVHRGQLPKVDYVAGVPDSGVPHAIGFANRSGKPFARPFVKYTPTWPRSFMPTSQEARNQVAKMKQIPVPELIEGKKLLFVDDSIVRGTQLRETVEFLYESGAEEVHMRSACPPVMYGCKYLNFSRSNSDMELLARRTIQELEGDEGQQHIEEYADASTERGRCMLRAICEKLGFDSLGYQSLDGLLEAIGIDRDKICTYCWTGKE